MPASSQASLHIVRTMVTKIVHMPPGGGSATGTPNPVQGNKFKGYPVVGFDIIWTMITIYANFRPTAAIPMDGIG
jgi:hypothetical protein